MENIEKDLTNAGFKLFGNSKKIENLILDIVKTKNQRYLKAIPFLIYKHNLDTKKLYSKINQGKKNKALQLTLNSIINFTKKIFQDLNIKKEIIEILYFTKEETKEHILKNQLNYLDFKKEFELQLKNENKEPLTIEKQKIYAERDLQMNLSQLFTKKEKEIIKRLIDKKPISRTDYEYYSRKTKKKFKSIIGLQEFAKTIYSKSPKYDEQLYHLKKLLEKWFETNLKTNKIKIENFFIWEKNKISINFIKNKTQKEKEKSFNILIKLNQIKDTNILDLLKKYPEHNFTS